MANRLYQVILELLGKDKVSPAAKSATKSLGGLGTAAKVAGSLITIALAKKAVAAAADLAVLGAQSLHARDRLIAFAGGSARATEMLDALIDASDGTIDRLTATQQAARLLQMGIADTAEEMSMIGAIVGKLGDQTLTLDSRMEAFTLMLANQSKRRLDTFGLSIENVTRRQKELEEQGYSTSDAFEAAVYEEGARALDILDDSGDSLLTTLNKLAVAATNVKTGLGELVAAYLEDALEEMGADVDGFIDRVEMIPLTISRLYAFGTAIGDVVDAIRRGEDPIDAWANSFRAANRAVVDVSGTWQQQMRVMNATAGEFNEAQVIASAAIARTTEEIERQAAELDKLAAAEKKAAQAMVAGVKEYAAYQIALRRRNEQLDDFTRRAEDLERGHQERLAAIIASGQQSASEIARDAYNERLTALNAVLQAEASALQAAQQARMTALRAAQSAEMDALRAAQQARLDAVRNAMQAELAALAEGIARRNFLQRLADMAQRHQDRLDAIRQQGADTATDIENRRFQGVMDNLNKEQAARLAALRARYGKGDDAGSKRESLEEEHRRRMMGLYTDSAREQEQKRYEAALKELEFQTDEAALLEDFQAEKAAAEKAHRDELERIRQEDLQRQIDEEKKRYADAVKAAERQEQVRIDDAKAREAITDQFAAIIAALEAADRADREALDKTHNDARAAEAASSDAEREAMEESHNTQREYLANQLNATLKTIRDAEIAQRLLDENAAHDRSLNDLERAQDRANSAWNAAEKQREIDLIAHWLEVEWITVESMKRIYERMFPSWDVGGMPGDEDRPPEFAAGTSFHQGGLAIVGEKGPELLDLPRGTSVTPMSKIGGVGASIVIHNYFGRDSVRSERDVRKIGSDQEKFLRLLGTKVL